MLEGSPLKGSSCTCVRGDGGSQDPAVCVHEQRWSVWVSPVLPMLNQLWA